MTLSCHKLKSKFTKKIAVNTNDAENRNISLVCKGEIRESVKLKPNRLSFGQVPRGTTTEKKMTLTRGDGGPLKLNLKPTKSKNIETRLEEIEPGERYELVVTLKPPFASNRVRENLRLETGVEEDPETTIYVYATVKARVAAKPNRFTVPRKPSDDWSQSVLLVWADASEHKVIGAKTTDPELTVDITEEAGKQRIVLKAPAGYQPKRSTGTVIVQTDDPVSPEVRVPIRFAGVTRARPKQGKATAPTPRSPKAITPRTASKMKKPAGKSAASPQPAQGTDKPVESKGKGTDTTEAAKPKPEAGAEKKEQEKTPTSAAQPDKGDPKKPAAEESDKS